MQNPAGIRCAECKGRHATVAAVRECHEAARYGAEDVHHCDDQTCTLMPGCAAYRYDSHAAGYWGQGEEAAERLAWAREDALAAAYA